MLKGCFDDIDYIVFKYGCKYILLGERVFNIFLAKMDSRRRSIVNGDYDREMHVVDT